MKYSILFMNQNNCPISKTLRWGSPDCSKSFCPKFSYPIGNESTNWSFLSDHTGLPVKFQGFSPINCFVLVNP